jgi:hypothetical protein
MQIVQFVVDLHLVYFGSESNVFDVVIHLMRSPSQPILISRPPIGLNFRYWAAAMDQTARGKKPVTNGHANGNALVHFDV